MKILIIAQEKELKDLLAQHLAPIGFEIEQITDPSEAIQRFEELQPEMIIFSAADFPEHWKLLLKLLREEKSKEESIFIILCGEDFPFEEAAKASYLGVNGIIKDDLADKKEMRRLTELFKRYRSIQDQRKFHRLIPLESDRLQLLFTNPQTMAIVTGKLAEISIQGASFLPSSPAMIKGLKRGQELALCSLRIGQNIISLNCRVTRSKNELGLQFKSFTTGGHHKLFNFIQKHSERSLKKAVS